MQVMELSYTGTEKRLEKCEVQCSTFIPESAITKRRKELIKEKKESIKSQKAALLKFNVHAHVHKPNSLSAPF